MRAFKQKKVNNFDSNLKDWVCVNIGQVYTMKVKKTLFKSEIIIFKIKITFY